ncbi:kinase-associated lipoprotein B [Paenibacillus humicola]|uniref:kinase-associated lipoprotein B n=1 Tax=Paenibacillus humicola TaxID=3110540 RepID=UPI00237BBDFF|nr:kinase-associated lipoprotein B [Paenibacillus humicola]
MRSGENGVPAPGGLAAFGYKTGEYVGELMEWSGSRGLLKVLAVLKHPVQGDLHRPYDPDVPMFHERRALGLTEKTYVPAADIRPYEGEVPAYQESLRAALAKQKAELDRLKRWAERGIANLEQLEQDYR